ncbi:MAG: hypothetical protein ACK2TX_02165 [Anaerolineales bacterium]
MRIHGLRLPWLIVLLIVASLACGGTGFQTGLSADISIPSEGEQRRPVFVGGTTTAYGFFPTPPEATFESILGHFRDLAEHADFVLFQPNVPWTDFLDSAEGQSKSREDQRNMVTLARQLDLDWVFVVDPLNGLNRTEFLGLPESWTPSFSTPEIRRAFTNFTLWIVREFHPRYLGLASEINTYLDAHPDDAENYRSLYREIYDLVKQEAPDTQIFVTFQWDDLNNMFTQASEGRPARQTNWEQVEAFEPRLDLWVISSYPFFIFPQETGVPPDYYAPLLARTEKPLAVAEGGWSTEPVGMVNGDEAGQAAYLEAIHSQLGVRLAFWTYLLLNDLDMDSIGPNAIAGGMDPRDLDTLSYFVHLGLRQVDGTPKPALGLWDHYRSER